MVDLFTQESLEVAQREPVFEGSTHGGGCGDSNVDHFFVMFSG